MPSAYYNLQTKHHLNTSNELEVARRFGDNVADVYELKTAQNEYEFHVIHDYDTRQSRLHRISFGGPPCQNRGRPLISGPCGWCGGT
jgi:hypothetical protein